MNNRARIKVPICTLFLLIVLPQCYSQKSLGVEFDLKMGKRTSRWITRLWTLLLTHTLVIQKIHLACMLQKNWFNLAST